MYDLPLGERADVCLLEEQRLQKDIEGVYGQDAIELNYGHVAKEVRWALMAVSDIWVLTPLRQGYTVVLC